MKERIRYSLYIGPENKLHTDGTRKISQFEPLLLYKQIPEDQQEPKRFKTITTMSTPEPQLAQQIWDNLKIAVIIIAALAPIIIAFLAIRFNRMKRRLINEHQTNQGVVQKRLETYGRMGPKLNDLLCFFCYTGNWKELTPIDIMRLKRELDKDMTISKPLFSEDLSKTYNSFTLLCFVSHSGWEHEEKIKSLYELRQKHNLEWNDEWIPFFDTNNVVEATTLKERYDILLESFKKELSL